MYIEPAYAPVCVCFACDNNYAPYLGVTIYSMLHNANTDRYYDILIMHNRIKEEHQHYLQKVGALFSHATLRLIDVSAFDNLVKDRVLTYITSATNYRLFLLGDMFAKYHRMLYLDCDMVVTGDIAPLYDMDLEGNAIGAVEMAEARYFCYAKKAIMFDGMPYNFTNYKNQVLKLENPEFYFNAGMVLFDLDRCREMTNEKEALRVLNEAKYHYNDQDVLNILFNTSVKPLDFIWNYAINIPMYHEIKNEAVQKLFANTLREDFVVIHYNGGEKPWMGEVPMGEHYNVYAGKLKALLYKV